MTGLSDQELLQDYAAKRNEAAFAELTRRHIDLVYSAALRMVHDTHLAEDVTQGVFAALARNSRRLGDRPVLNGWLHRTAQNIAAQTVRTEVRRRTREQEVASMNELLSVEPDTVWEHVVTHLDAALSELSESDRDALLLRYFAHKSAQEMAQILGVTSEAAQKRVSRAVERLRELFGKRGVTVGVGGLAAAISAHAVHAAPASLAAAVSHANAVSASVAMTAKTLTMTTLQKMIASGAMALALGFAFLQAKRASSLNSQLESAQRNQKDAALTIERDKGNYGRQIANLKAENSRLNTNSGELLRLRNEVTRLRNAAAARDRNAAASAAAANDTATSDFRTFSATNHFVLTWGQTVVAGGWTIPSGDRVLILATPSPKQDPTQLDVKINIVEIAAESQQSVWSDLHVPESMVQFAKLMQQEDADALLGNLSQSGASTVRQMQISTTSGVEAAIKSGANESDAGSIELLPVISGDGRSIDLNMTSVLNYPRVPNKDSTAAN